MDTPSVAVIVPVYNVEKYLEKCLDSIIHQTYQNLEIVLVDDGSKDKSGEVCDAYASRDSRIKVFHTENRGLSAARNFGVDHSVSPYIFFSDSDDYLELDCIEYLLGLLINYNTKVSCCDAYVDYPNRIKPYHQNKNEILFLDSHKAVADMLYNEHFDYSAWGKIYSRDLFREIRYPEDIRIGEEAGTTYKLLLETDMVVIGELCKYHYVKNVSGLTSPKFNVNQWGYLDTGRECMEYISVRAPEVLGAAKRKYLYLCFWVLRRVVYDQNNRQEEIKLIMREIKKYRKSNFFDRRVKMREKIAILVSIFGPTVFKISWSIYSKIREYIR